MKNILSKPFTLAGIALIIGIGLGWFFFSGSEQEAVTPAEQSTASKPTIWTCAMHPQIRQTEPGKCPICAMDLTPLGANGSGLDQLVMSSEAVLLANIQTTPVTKGTNGKAITLQGKVQKDERSVALITARYGGRIDQLYVNFTGAKVSKGAPLASIYSPALINAQQELLEAMKIKAAQPALYQAARSKLQLWDLTEQQVDAIENAAKPLQRIDIVSPQAGFVTNRAVTLGQYVKEGMALFEVTDLNRVWVVFDAYETDLGWLKEGQSIEFTAAALPGQHFNAPITYIDPIVDPKTRTVGVRVDMPNTNFQLKPDLLVQGKIDANVSTSNDVLTVPKTAVLWTGKRSVVYVWVPNTKVPTFEFREVTLGMDLGSSYEIIEGLREGEKVVTNGAFKVDASAQLAGKHSMMNRPGGNPGEELTFFQLKVAGNCVLCKQRIEEAANGMPHVHQAVWDVDSKWMQLYYDAETVDTMQIHQTIAKAGHSTQVVSTDSLIFNQLPSCCQYPDGQLKKQPQQQ